MRNKDRNKPCVCGSGIKMKKCFPTHNQPKTIDPNTIDYIRYDLKDDEDYLYHIVHKKTYMKFKDVGLKGGEYPWKGYLYCVNTDQKRVWNGISSYSVGDGFSSHNKPYVVLGISKNLLKENNIEIISDPYENGDLTGYYHRRFNLGDKYIHPSSIKVVYEGTTDMNQYECEDRWDFSYEKIMRNPSIPSSKKMFITKDQLTIKDSIYGEIHYSNRYDTTTQKFLKKNPQLSRMLKMYEGLPHTSKGVNENTTGMSGEDFMKNQTQGLMRLFGK